MRIPDRAREAAIRASDLAFRRRHGLTRADGWPYTRALNPEEAENAELEDDDEEDETEERDPARSRARDAS